MNPSFERLMAAATRLTRTGNLQAATAAIQAALGRAKAPARQAAFAAGDETEVIDVQAREVAVDPAPATAPPPAAQPRPQAGEFTDGTYTDANGTLAYKLFSPPGSSIGTKLPLVVMLHGCTQNPDDFAAGTGMNDAALAHGYFVLYPAQAQRANPSRCWNWFKHNHQQRGRGEPALLAAMTRQVIDRCPIDPQRVYVAGLSAGGAMAAILGEVYPELFAAVGVHSGLPTGAANDMPSAFTAMKGGAAARAAATHSGPPTIVFHGDQDGTVHPVNGERVASAASSRTAALTERVDNTNGRAATRHTFRDHEGRVVAEHWVVHGAGHAWSGGSLRGSYADSQGPDATREMLRFFAAHGRVVPS